MEEDLLLEPAKENGPYRKHTFQWWDGALVAQQGLVTSAQRQDASIISNSPRK
jgi:hypothetical protein